MLDAKTLISMHSTSPRELENMISDEKRICDEVIFSICQMANSEVDKKTRAYFGEVLLFRYYDFIFNVCFRIMKDEYKALDLHDYIGDRLQEKLGTSFFPSFRWKDDFSKSFRITLNTYIIRYFSKDFMKKQSQNMIISSEITSLNEQYAKSENTSEEKDEAEIRKKVKYYIIEQFTNDETISKHKLFELFFNVQPD